MPYIHLQLVFLYLLLAYRACRNNEDNSDGYGMYRDLQNGCCDCQFTCSSPLNFDLTLVH